MHRSIVTFHQVLSLGFSAGCLFVGLGQDIGKPEGMWGGRGFKFQEDFRKSDLKCSFRVGGCRIDRVEC